MYITPDDAVRAWWKIKTSIETTGSAEMDIVSFQACKCGHRQHNEIKNKQGLWFDRCLKCRALWEPLPEYAVITARPEALGKHTFSQCVKVRGDTRVPGDGGGGAILRFVDLDKAIHELPDPQATAYGFYVVGDTDGKEVTGAELKKNWVTVAREMHRLAPDTGSWNAERVRWAIRACRRALEEALEVRGLWTPTFEVAM